MTSAEPNSYELLSALLTGVPAPHDVRGVIDIFEATCRRLSRSGIAAAVLQVRGGKDGYIAVAQRIDGADLRRSLRLPGLRPGHEQPVFSTSGTHPLRTVVPAAAEVALPAITLPLPRWNDAPLHLVVLFAPFLTADHLSAVEPFATLLGAAAARADAETRLRELSGGLEQRVRSRTAELTVLHDLSLSLLTAASDRDAVHQTAAAVQRGLACDVAAALICADKRHIIAIAGRGVLGPALMRAIDARLVTALDAVSGGVHRDCTVRPPDVIEGTGGQAGIALDGEPLGMLDAPVTSSGRVIGLVTLATLRAPTPPEHARLLVGVAGQLGAAADRLSGARSAELARLTALMDGLTDGVVLLDAGRRILATNRPGRELLTALGPAQDGTDTPADVAALAGAALAGALARGEVEMITDEEVPRHLRVGATRVTDVTGGPAVALTLHDATHELLVRERLFQSEKMASVGQLVSGVAHEINNPLAGIMGFSQLMLARSLDADARKAVTTIYGEAERASKIVQNLLSFARRRGTERTLVDINDTIRRVLELRDYDIKVNNINVVSSLDPALPPVYADASQIQQVLLNLITNAEHAVRGGASPTVWIDTEHLSNTVRLTIADSGPGVSPEYLRKVFDPFFTTKPVGEGTGLGLAITYGIVEEHAGRIAVTNRSGAGAQFTIELPVAPEGATGAPSEDADDNVDDEPEPSGRSILVVDDVDAIRDVLEGLLTLDGHEVHTATTGAEALELVRQYRYDAVISDIRMPEMDGITFFRELQTVDPAATQRIIFTTGDMVSPDTRNFLQSAGVPYLTKPFKLREIRRVVAEILDNGRREDGGATS